MSDVPRMLDAQADTEWEIESEEGSLWTGTRVLMGLVAMIWVAVAFAYFYLRSLDRHGAWIVPHMEMPPFLLGTMIVICVVAQAGFVHYGASRLREGLAFEWMVAAWLGVVSGLIATGLQIWELTRLGFYPGESGYTSVFVGFALLNVGFLLTGALWPETIVARSMRLRGQMLPHEFFGLSVQPEVRLLRASLHGCILYLWYMAAVSLFFWFLFYVLH